MTEMSDPIDSPQKPKRRKKTRAEINTTGETLNAQEAATLLGWGLTWFWKLRKQYNLQRIPASSERRPRYRREEVLALKHAAPPVDIAQLAQEAAAREAANPRPETPYEIEERMAWERRNT